jgi:YHS domain-containing protein
LVYNLKQFEEFMELFEFYKNLSYELNNEQSFKIEEIGEPYFFVSSENSKEFEHKGSEVFNSDGILIGYKMRQEDYDQLSNEDKDKVNTLVDVELKGDGNTLRSIRRAGKGNIFLSNCEKITERDVTSMVAYHFVSLYNRGGKLIISGDLQNTDAISYEYLNLYDMG